MVPKTKRWRVWGYLEHSKNLSREVDGKSLKKGHKWGMNLEDTVGLALLPNAPSYAPYLWSLPDVT